MVITKVFQIKNSNKLKQGINYIEDKDKITEILSDKLDYIVDEEKTLDRKNNRSGKEKNKKVIGNETDFEFISDENGNMELVSCYNLSSVKFAYDEMMLTKMQAKEIFGKRGNGKADVLAHHIIQSFSPEDKLTPEEVHEIGRRTVLELTRGEHEFVIATHIDKGHLHNHIIFNTTNGVTLKKFKWKKGTKKNLEHISDKHADLFGAKIIDRDEIISHKKYDAYKKQNTLRYEIKDRLNFLLKNSNSLEDFLKKAKELDIEVDITRKEVRYKMLDKNQERYIRDGTLSKKGYYSLYNIIRLTGENKSVIARKKIKNEYEKYKKEKSDDFEMRFTIEPWQVLEETKRGIYLEVEFGINNKGTILIPHNKVDKLENGYEVFIKRNDYFYFLNAKNSVENKFIKGTTLAKQLSHDNNEVVVYKNYYIGKIDTLIEEFNYLSENKVTSSSEFLEFQERFKKNLEDVDKELNRLDEKIIELNKIYSALLGVEKENNNQRKVAKEILRKFKISPKMTNKTAIQKLLSEVKIERELLYSKYEYIVQEYKYTEKLEKNVEMRKENKKINNNFQR